MNTDTPLRQTLNRITDTIVVGLLVAAASLLMVTAFAALRAGVAVLADDDVGGGLVSRFAGAIRQQFGRNVLLGLLFVAAAGIGATDVSLAMTGGLGLATVPVAAAGLTILLAVAVLPFWAAASIRHTPDAAMPGLLRHTVLLAAAHPGRSAVLLAIVLAAIAATAAVPLLAPIALGVLARLSTHLPAFGLKLAITA